MSVGAQKRYTDEELISLIRNLGVPNIEELCEKTGYTSNYLTSKRLRPLIQSGRVRMFKLVIGGSGITHKYKSIDLFKNLAYLVNKPHVYFYINEEKACEFLTTSLSLSRSLPKKHRAQLTRHLKRCLPRTLFNKVYERYS